MQVYKNLPIIGTLPGSEIKNPTRKSRRQSVYSELYGQLSLAQLKEVAGDKFFVVLGTNDNYYKTVSSWDVKPDYNFTGTASHTFGLEFFEIVYKDIFDDCVANSEEIASFIDWTKSPGWPHTFFGFKTKTELVSAIRDTLFYERISTLPIWNVAAKVEFKALADIEENKIRLFQIPCFEFLYSQLKYGKRISLRLMNKHWSAYGFNPYAGGFNRLAESLLRKPWRGCYDISGWDKFLPVLPDIYDILSKYVPAEEQEEFTWVVENTCNFLLKLTNGNVIKKSYGNASGSGVTTRDNIFGHIIIFAAGLYAAHLETMGVAPSINAVHGQLVYLYGDDNVFALDDEFRLMCDPAFLGRHLAQYGLKLKFFFGGLNADLHVLSFLGASFEKVGHLWYPKYDIERLATTMIYEQNRLTLSQHLGKAFTLMVMSYPSGKFSIFRDAYKALINSDEVKKNLHDPTINSYSLVGVPENVQIESFYSGSEADGIKHLVLDFSPDGPLAL